MQCILSVQMGSVAGELQVHQTSSALSNERVQVLHLQPPLPLQLCQQPGLAWHGLAWVTPGLGLDTQSDGIITKKDYCV